MAEGIILGTCEDRNKINRIVDELGFKYDRQNRWIRNHNRVEGLYIQILNSGKKSWSNGCRHIETEIEFNDLTEKFPRENPQALEVLIEIYRRIPDLKYIECSFSERRKTPSVYPINTFLEKINKREEN